MNKYNAVYKIKKLYDYLNTLIDGGDDLAEMREYCEANGIEFVWLEDALRQARAEAQNIGYAFDNL